jgi:hypothetical protein
MSNTVIKIALTPGAALLASGLLGSTTTAQQAECTARTQIARGSYPFPVCHVAGTKQRRVVLVAEIERTLREMQPAANQEPEVQPAVPARRRGPGRPRKSALTITHLTQRTPVATQGAGMTSAADNQGASHARGSAVALALGGHEAGAEPPSAQCRRPGGAASERSRGRAERPPKRPFAKWGAKPPSPAQAGQPGHVDHDDSQDREQSESGRVARPAAGDAASLAEARSHAVAKAAAQGSASPSERAEIARQRGGSAGPQPEHAAFPRPPEQAQAILTIAERSPGSQQDRTRIAATTDGRC